MSNEELLAIAEWYEREGAKTEAPLDDDTLLTNAALKLVGEIRELRLAISQQTDNSILLELGDIWWYIRRFCKLLTHLLAAYGQFEGRVVSRSMIVNTAYIKVLAAGDAASDIAEIVGKAQVVAGVKGGPILTVLSRVREGQTESDYQLIVNALHVVTNNLHYIANIYGWSWREVLTANVEKLMGNGGRHRRADGSIFFNPDK